MTRADAASLGANWTVSTGLNSFSIVSNKGGAPGNDLTTGINYNGIYTGGGWTGGNDQYAELTISALDARSDGGPIARGVTGDGSGYICDINNPDTVALGGSMHVEAYEISTGGVFTLIGSTATLTVSAADVLRVDAEGTTIRAKVNGTQQATGTNSAHTTGKPGIRFWHNQNGSTVQFTLWAAGDFAAAGGRVPYQPQYQTAPIVAQ